jgi:hypothetical protein
LSLLGRKAKTNFSHIMQDLDKIGHVLYKTVPERKTLYEVDYRRKPSVARLIADIIGAGERGTTAF